MLSAEESVRPRRVEVAWRDTRPKRARLAAVGGIIGAIAASSCCIAPLALFSLGVGGAWIGNLAAMTPYQPIFVGVTLGFLSYGYYLLYWKRRKVCAESTACTPLSSNGIVKGALWAATLLVAAAVAFPYVAPLLLDV